MNTRFNRCEAAHSGIIKPSKMGVSKTTDGSEEPRNGSKQMYATEFAGTCTTTLHTTRVHST